MQRNDERPAGADLLERCARRIEMGERMTMAKVEDQPENERRQRLSAQLEQSQKRNQFLHDLLAAASEREQRLDRELQETKERIACLAEQQSRGMIEGVRQQVQAEMEGARQAAQLAQERAEDLRQKLNQAERDQKAAIQRGVNYNLAQRQVELDRLERDIQHAERNLASFRQKLREISSAEYENQRLNLDAEKALREIVLFGTTLNLYECEEIFPVNWGLLDQIVLGAESLAALIGDFKAARRLTEKPVSPG